MRFRDFPGLSAIVCVVALAGCADPAAGPSEDQTEAPAAPSLTSFTENDVKIPYHQPVIVPCGPERNISRGIRRCLQNSPTLCLRPAGER